jgi:hypothetical protein
VSYVVRISITRRTNVSTEACDRLSAPRALFRRFRCSEAPRILRWPRRRTVPELLRHLGELRGVIYRAERASGRQPRTFIHFFETPAQLICDGRGRQLYIQGGRYRVTPRGIEG